MRDAASKKKKAIRSALVAARRDELLTVKEWAAMTRENPQSIWRRIRLDDRDGGKLIPGTNSRKFRQPGVVRIGGHLRIDAAVALNCLRSVSTFAVVGSDLFDVILRLVQPTGAKVDPEQDLYLMVRNPKVDTGKASSHSTRVVHR